MFELFRNGIYVLSKLFKSKIYIMINNKWYNLTEFSELHPGGEEILRKLHKKDATDSFSSMPGHSNYLNSLKNFLITNKVLLDNLNKDLNKN